MIQEQLRKRLDTYEEETSSWIHVKGGSVLDVESAEVHVLKLVKDKEMESSDVRNEGSEDSL
jgi:hypothetical protein